MAIVSSQPAALLKPFPTGYDVAVIDVPWGHYGAGDKMGAAAKEYTLMTDEEVKKLPVRQVLPGGGKKSPGVLFVWATCPRLDFAIECIGAWGLHYRGVAFVWVKTSKAGLPIRAQGVRPSIVKPLVELVLAASTEKKGRPLKLSSESIVQTVFDDDLTEDELDNDVGGGCFENAEPVLASRGEHSEKPQAVYDRIHAMYPNYRKVDIFSRQTRAGFDAWGNEAGKLDVVVSK